MNPCVQTDTKIDNIPTENDFVGNGMLKKCRLISVKISISNFCSVTILRVYALYDKNIKTETQ